ncbi:MAG: DUF2508 family protein [Lachnospiraceae bacterium]|nr:DUF2508 family protein [Lachnospiraceae bacterium]
MDMAERAEVIAGINDVRSRLFIAFDAFNNITDDALIDSCIYEIISLNERYRYFLRLAKEGGIKADGFEDRRR